MKPSNCPKDGAELVLDQYYEPAKGEARCPSCGGRWQVTGEFKPEHAAPKLTMVKGKRRIMDRCPYDNAGLVVAHTIDYAGLARFVCPTPHCEFEITQGWG